MNDNQHIYIYIQHQSKVWTHLLIQVLFFIFIYFSYFLHCIIIVKTSELWNNTWNHVVTIKVLNKSKYILYLRFFKVATVCLDDSFAHSWHSLNQLHLECFSNSWALVGCFSYTLRSDSSQTKPSQIGWGRGIVEARSSDATFHHSPSWLNSPYTAWKCVRSLSCWKTNDSPSMHKPDGMAYRCRVLW